MNAPRNQKSAAHEWKVLRAHAKLMSDLGHHGLAAELMRRAKAAKEGAK